MEREPKIVRVLFNDDMARAIVSGRKTVTRRPIVPGTWNPNGPEYTGESMVLTNSDARIGTQAYFRTHEAEWHGIRLPCLPGDILIGRECWAPNDGYEPFYRATDGEVGWRPLAGWRPSIHMPDAAARIRRRVVSVTVERLQDITEEDAVREGIRRWTKDGSVYKFSHVEPGDIGCTPWVDMARTGLDAYARLWDSIYAAKGLGWAVNPWVWPIEFERENVQEVSDGR